ncbi:MAG: MarR family transcriptional regulator [Solobacterium sp.]|jgi:DNA-binding MarR family transcriptional regulator|nr:MarR family transcriptional regulator [Solobacterium sp.]MCH4048365.1 MarR family transcriptional regulator [Solobacterium sp.]MCH4074783.1 MarR family transcriptional regulator [Solobacterium sp.]MCI1314760.1 MarR family transcriptional regulator [Solobacterium sp.]MCI1347129.1 MarR family transcriptional regulator [Solobacterium sp.]
MSEEMREITKIAREVSKFTIRTMKEEGIGTGEFDFIHVVRHHPGITQKGIREILGLDKGACARRAASLEAKGYLIRKQDEKDKRVWKLYASDKAEHLKLSKVEIENVYYDWLAEGLDEGEKQQFYALLQKLYVRNKAESKAGFPHIQEALNHHEKR